MLRSEPTAPTAPPCAVCRQPATFGFWLKHLCEACNARWVTTAPPLEALELAHADAHPEDVEARGVRTYAVTGETDLRWVILKPGVVEKVARAAAEAWLKAQAKARAA